MQGYLTWTPTRSATGKKDTIIHNACKNGDHDTVAKNKTNAIENQGRKVVENTQNGPTPVSQNYANKLPEPSGGDRGFVEFMLVIGGIFLTSLCEVFLFVFVSVLRF